MARSKIICESHDHPQETHVIQTVNMFQLDSLAYS